MGKEPKIVNAPVLLFDIIINSLDFLAKFLPKQFEDPAELAKIGKYYAVEDMLTTDPSEKVGARLLNLGLLHKGEASHVCDCLINFFVPLWPYQVCTVWSTLDGYSHVRAVWSL